MENRRKYIRIEEKFVTYAEVPFEVYEKRFFFNNLISKNIGGGGILLESKNDIPVGTILNLNFTLPSHKPIKAEGKIIHTEKTKNSKYEMGIEFTRIEKKAQKIIIKFCEKFAKKSKKNQGDKYE